MADLDRQINMLSLGNHTSFLHTSNDNVAQGYFLTKYFFGSSLSDTVTFCQLSTMYAACKLGNDLVLKI
jgi:hypothetical protein